MLMGFFDYKPKKEDGFFNIFDNKPKSDDFFGSDYKPDEWRKDKPYIFLLFYKTNQ